MQGVLFYFWGNFFYFIYIFFFFGGGGWSGWGKGDGKNGYFVGYGPFGRVLFIFEYPPKVTIF